MEVILFRRFLPVSVFFLMGKVCRLSGLYPFGHAKFESDNCSLVHRFRVQISFLVSSVSMCLKGLAEAKMHSTQSHLLQEVITLQYLSCSVTCFC